MINIVTAGDLHVFSGVEALITSACHYAREPIHFYILTGTLTKEEYQYQSLELQKEYLTKVIQSYKRNHEITFIDCTLMYNMYIQPIEKHLHGGNPYSTLRLLLDCFDINDKILYFDPDCIILHDLVELNSVLTDKYDIIVNNYSDTFCSGVIGINIPKCKNSGFFNNCRQLLATHLYSFPDQEAILNTKSDYFIYPAKYQIFPQNNSDINFETSQIIHFTGSDHIDKLYFMEDESSEQTQENKFGTSKDKLAFLQAEILENRKKFNYVYKSGGAKQVKMTDPNLIKKASKTLLKDIKNKLNNL